MSVKSFISVAALAAVTGVGGLAVSTATALTPSLIALGDLPGGSFNSVANAVSGDGSTVVGFGSFASATQAGTQAFLWTAGGGMRSLWDVLLTQGVNPAASGWSELTEATGISLDGNTIVGSGRRNGNTEAFIARLVGPSGPTRCGLSDVAGSGPTVGPDGELTADDVILFIGWFVNADVRADIAQSGQVPSPDGEFTADDIIVFISRFTVGC
jgi:hypothetical protein